MYTKFNILSLLFGSHFLIIILKYIKVVTTENTLLAIQLNKL